MLSLKTVALSAILLSQNVIAAASNNVAIYWGQNGSGDQQDLAYYCANSASDYVLVSFLNDFPDPTNINLSNMCGNTFPDGTLHCSNVAADIKTCQAQGKKIILSLGGAIGNYGFTDATQAQDFATTLWNKFGGGSDAERPFDDAVVDGFDLDIEHGSTTGYPELAAALRSIFAQNTSKQYTLSASPQCVYPDQYLGPVLSESYLDFAFVQFYNNYCAVDQTFNLATWLQFAKTAPNPNMKIFVGVPSDPAATDYVSAATLKSQIAQYACDPNFGGVSLWDASGEMYYVDNGEELFSHQVQDLLNSISCAVPSSSAPAPVASSASSVVSPVASSVSPVRPSYANSTIPGTVTATDIHTTIVTITSCSENKCHETAVTTGYVVVTDVNTVYTTYCPLTSSTPAAPVTPVVTVPVTTAPAVSAPVVTVPTHGNQVAVESVPAVAASSVPVVAVSSAPAVVAASSVVQIGTTITITRSKTEECTTCGVPTTVAYQSVPQVSSFSSNGTNGTAPVVSTYQGSASTLSNFGYLAALLAIIGFF